MSTDSIVKPNIRNRIILVSLVLAIILIPFFLFGSQIETWTTHFVSASETNKSWTAFVLSLMLASDIFLPIPSSIVSTGAGFLLGFINGVLVSFIGMTVGCVIGYGFGFSSRRALQWIGTDNFNRMEKFFQRSGGWAIVMTRPIPVLAEASVLFAGMSRMKLLHFMIVSALSNLGISLVYATVGVYSVSVNSFLLALAGAIAIRGIAKMIEAGYRRKNK
jgi:uncharacterized membrane protein YdjX (TVP38/TMEM64 family)